MGRKCEQIEFPKRAMHKKSESLSNRDHDHRPKWQRNGGKGMETIIWPLKPFLCPHSLANKTSGQPVHLGLKLSHSMDQLSWCPLQGQTKGIKLARHWLGFEVVC
jgi:hypothetical protein